MNATDGLRFYDALWPGSTLDDTTKARIGMAHLERLELDGWDVTPPQPRFTVHFDHHLYFWYVQDTEGNHRMASFPYRFNPTAEQDANEYAAKKNGN